MKQKIANWTRDVFIDRDAAKWAEQWLCTFFAPTNAFETIKGISDMHSDFGGNEFYQHNKAALAPLCAHAAQSYAECAPFMSQQAESGWTVTGVMQAIEPVIMAARLAGRADVRKSLLIALNNEVV